jgi:hypothetical protein
MTKSGNFGERYNLTKSAASEPIMETRTGNSFNLPSGERHTSELRSESMQ